MVSKYKPFNVCDEIDEGILEDDEKVEDEK